ncbi:diguanylate cyclase domain-containing protein [Motilimonas sp. KMU-193]|uniref:transporter substrate-binding domain-containing diguanylate cyclase n=1 Tax=Motilimonas sp. KMU-193 TaxID=3388668 RepID=UPI00396B394D
MANSIAWKPYSYLDEDGQPKGLLIDYWLEWGRVNQTPVEFLLLDWQDSLMAVKEGRADVHAGLLYSDQRAEFLRFGAQIIPLSASLFIRSDQVAEAGLLMEQGQIPLGVVKGGFEATFAQEQYPNARLLEFKNNSLMLDKALNGELDVFISDHQVANFYLNSQLDPTSFVAVKQLYVLPIRAAVSGQNSALLAQINAGMARVNPDEINRIKQKWINTEKVHPVWVAWLVPIAAITLTLFIIAYIWQLKRAVKQRTAQLTQANEALALAAKSDYLTGLLNRRAFMHEFAKVLQDKKVDHLALLMIDIDRFKGINDHFGHLIGDQALAWVANILQQHSEKAVLVTRFGGEEFCLLYTNLATIELGGLAERIREAIANKPMPSNLGDISLSVSIGGAVADRCGEDLEQIRALIQRADKCLYQAKNQGRNQVCLAENEFNESENSTL